MDMENNLTLVMLLATGLVVAAIGVWGARQPRRIRPPKPIPGMRLATVRLAGTERRPHGLRIFGYVGQEALLVHLSRLPGVKVVATKSDFSSRSSRFEAYFLYKERLFLQDVVVTPGEWVPLLLKPAVYLLGQPADEALFAEIENHIRSCSRLMAILGSVGAMRFWFLRRSPPEAILDRYDGRPSAREDNDLPDLLAEAELFLAAGQRKMAIELLEHASRAEPARDDIRKRLLALKAGP